MKLLLYLSSWYWSWMEYKLVFATINMQNPEQKLEKAIVIVTQPIEDDLATPHINEAVLSRIIIAEFSKTFLTKEVDEENKEGFFNMKLWVHEYATMKESIDFAHYNKIDDKVSRISVLLHIFLFYFDMLNRRKSIHSHSRPRLHLKSSNKEN